MNSFAEEKRMKNKTRPVMYILLCILPVVMTVPLLVTGHTKMKYFFGELAYCLFIVDVLLGLRPEWIERLVELKKLYCLHGLLAIVAVIGAACHIEMSHLHGFAALLGWGAFYGAIATVLLAVGFLTSQVLRVPFLGRGVAMLRQGLARIGITREMVLLVHMLSPLIVVMVFFHVVLIHKFNHLGWFMLFFCGYFALFALGYAYWGIYHRLIVARYTVVRIDWETASIFKITLKHAKGDVITAHGGQFVFIHAPFAMPNEYHPFSVLQINHDGTELTLGIKQVGDFTTKLAHVAPGTQIKIRGVYGHFTAPTDDTPVLAVAGGIGITPCIGILQSLPHNQTGYLLWSVRSRADACFSEELTQLRATHPHIRVILHDDSELGYLDKEFLIQQIPELRQQRPLNCFICGPAPMMTSVERQLKAMQVPHDRIIDEGFIF